MSTRRGRSGTRLDARNIGFLLAKASQRWNELLYDRFVCGGFPEVRPSYGALLMALYAEDGLRLGELARRARLSKQTLTTMARALERDGLIERRNDPTGARATRVHLTARAHELRPVAARALRELDDLTATAVSSITPEELAGALGAIATLSVATRRTSRSHAA